MCLVPGGTVLVAHTLHLRVRPGGTQATAPHPALAGTGEPPWWRTGAGPPVSFRLHGRGRPSSDGLGASATAHRFTGIGTFSVLLQRAALRRGTLSVPSGPEGSVLRFGDGGPRGDGWPRNLQERQVVRRFGGGRNAWTEGNCKGFGLGGKEQLRRRLRRVRSGSSGPCSDVDAVVAGNSGHGARCGQSTTPSFVPAALCAPSRGRELRSGRQVSTTGFALVSNVLVGPLGCANNIAGGERTDLVVRLRPSHWVHCTRSFLGIPRDVGSSVWR